MPRVLPAIVCLIALMWPQPASAQTVVHRCVGSNGGTIYSDRSCAHFDAIERPAPGHAGSTSRRGCRRTPDALLTELRLALESHDVNRLAGLYHWPGTSGAGSLDVMDRLEALSRRPLVALELLTTAPASAAVTDTPAALPLGVRIEQMRGAHDITSSTTQLSLRRNAECWWMHF